MRSSAPVLGKTLSHYRIEGRLGEGGIGVVYSATDIQLHRRVAIKFAAEAQDADARRCLAEEARAASSLNHPNISQIYDFGETEDGIPFFVMELVEGGGLDVLIQGGPMDPGVVICLGEEVASALEEAHGKGIIHRDIKPANIFITGNGRAKVLDFGIAKRVEAPVSQPAGVDATTLTLAREILPTALKGTPPYMSPEQSAGRVIDARSDLFSLGAVLYECLTGRRPFRGSDIRETLAAIQTLDPDPPSASTPSVPKPLDCIVLKLLAKNPAARYQSARQLLSDLQALRQPPLPLAERSVPDSKSFRRVIALLSLAVLVLIAGGVGTWWWTHRPYVPKSEALRWYDMGLKALRDGTYRTAATALARAWQGIGDYKKAESYLQDASGLMKPGPDDIEIARIEEGLGDLRNDQGRFREAIQHFERSYNINKSVNDRNGIGIACIGKATSLWQLGDYVAARQPFEEAMTIAKERDLKNLKADILTAQAKISLSQQNNAEAGRLLKKLNGYLPALAVSEVGEIKILHWLARSRNGARREAAQGCIEVLAIFTGQPQSGLVADAKLACAEAALEAGDKGKSETLAAEAQTFYAKNLCHERGWRALLLMALSQGGATPAIGQAEEELLALQREWQPEDFKTYRSRPDIQRLLKKLTQIKEHRL